LSRPDWAQAIERDFDLPPETQAILDEAVKAYGRLEEIRAALDEQGLLVPARYDGMKEKPNPLLAAERAARDAYIRALRALNLPTD